MPEVPSATTPGPRTILAVSHEHAHARACHSALTEAGYTVLLAPGSSDALKICEQYEGRLDLLLTDLVLPAPELQLASPTNRFPHVNGFDLAMRATAMRQGLRIILMCKDPERELATHGIPRTALPVITKPLDPASLIDLVHEVLHQPPPTLGQKIGEKAANDTVWFG